MCVVGFVQNRAIQSPPVSVKKGFVWPEIRRRRRSTRANRLGRHESVFLVFCGVVLSPLAQPGARRLPKWHANRSRRSVSRVSCAQRCNIVAVCLPTFTVNVCLPAFSVDARRVQERSPMLPCGTEKGWRGNARGIKLSAAAHFAANRTFRPSAMN
jgi:hypothetical protein